MTKQRLFELMREAGFNTDWVAHPEVKETVAKYERFANLVERGHSDGKAFADRIPEENSVH